MNESSKRVPPFGLRLPSDLKERVQQAADQGSQSMNALIVSVLEAAFPQPTINLHELAAFLDGVVAECDARENEGRDNPYIAEVNRVLAGAKEPWTMGVVDGTVRFYPYRTPDMPAPKLKREPDRS